MITWLIVDAQNWLLVFFEGIVFWAFRKTNLVICTNVYRTVVLGFHLSRGNRQVTLNKEGAIECMRTAGG